MKPLQAEVLCNGRVAGILRRSKTTYFFRYTPDYLQSELPAVSLTLPKQAKAYESPFLFPFFYGLLAEGVAKQLQCCELGIDERDHLARLIRTAHTETIGAVTVREISAP